MSGVVARNIGGVKLLVRKVIEQIEQCVGQQVQVGGRERLEEARGGAERDDVLVPEFPAPARATNSRRRGSARKSAPIAATQLRQRRLVVLVRARVDLPDDSGSAAAECATASPRRARAMRTYGGRTSSSGAGAATMRSQGNHCCQLS